MFDPRLAELFLHGECGSDLLNLADAIGRPDQVSAADLVFPVPEPSSRVTQGF